MICPYCQHQFEVERGLLYECPKCRGVFGSTLAAPTASTSFGESDPSRVPSGTAALIEALGGIFQIFGLGHIYAGRVGAGLVFMFGYWLVLGVNVLLAFAVVGFFTGPMCWALTMVVCIVSASRS